MKNRNKDLVVFCFYTQLPSINVENACYLGFMSESNTVSSCGLFGNRLVLPLDCSV